MSKDHGCRKSTGTSMGLKKGIQVWNRVLGWWWKTTPEKF